MEGERVTEVGGRVQTTGGQARCGGGGEGRCRRGGEGRCGRGESDRSRWEGADYW